MADTALKEILGEGLESRASAAFARRGLDLSDEIRRFVLRSVEQPAPRRTSLADGRKAFYELRRQAAENGLQDMTLDDINREITLARMGR